MLLLALVVLLGGCGGNDGGGGGGGDGGGGGEPKAPHSVAGVRACLASDQSFHDVEALPPGQAGRTVLSPRERAVVTDAVRGASSALIARAGGPQEKDGTIIEAPARVFELHLFPDAAAAGKAGDHLRAAVGHGALDGVGTYGPWVLVHYSFGIGRPGTVGLDDAEAKPVTDCLRETGYL